jgi:hypothetical protein
MYDIDKLHKEQSNFRRQLAIKAHYEVRRQKYTKESACADLEWPCRRQILDYMTSVPDEICPTYVHAIDQCHNHLPNLSE